MKIANRFYNGSIGLSILIVLAGLALLLSCSDRTIFSSGSGMSDTDDLDAILSVDLAKSINVDPGSLAKPDGDVYLICSDFASHEFDDDGFNLRIQLDGEEIVFSIPEDAIDDDDDLEIEIYAEKWSTEFGPVFCYTCLPSGLVFEEPITLKQPLSNPDGEVENLFWNNPEINQWVVDNSATVISEIAKFEISHFSKYAISD